jgi:hypothetical protein
MYLRTDNDVSVYSMCFILKYLGGECVCMNITCEYVLIINYHDYTT